MNEQQATSIGERLIELLDLPVKNGRVDTSFGNTTPAGLARIVEREFSRKEETDSSFRSRISGL